jgi:plastocyanin
MGLSRYKRHLRKPLLMALAALLGASVVVLPAVASSEATINAYSYAGQNSWQPNAATIEAGGVVKLNNTSGEYHGVEWKSEIKPKCSAGVPETAEASKAAIEWHGSCTFTQAGTYTFWCTIHGKAMSGTITVSAAGTTTTSTTSTTTGTTPTSGGPGSGGSGQGGSSASPTATESPLAAGSSSAVKVASSQRGGSVRGSVKISPAGEGGVLEVDALAKSAALASNGHGSRVRVGKLVLSHLHRGSTTFSVQLSRRARSALHRHHRLALSLRIIVTPLSGSPLTVTRSVTMHA